MKRISQSLVFTAIVVAGSVCFAQCDVASAAEGTGYRVERTIEFQTPEWNGHDVGHIAIEALLDEHDGRLAGVATVAVDWAWEHSMVLNGPAACPEPNWMKGTGTGPVSAEIVDGRLKMALDVQIVGTQRFYKMSDPKTGAPICSSLATEPWETQTTAGYIPWYDFDLPLVDGRHESLVEETAGGGVTLLLSAKVHTVAGPASAPPAGEIAVAAEHDLIPGHTAITNDVRFVVPTTAGPKPVRVRVSVKPGSRGSVAESREVAALGGGDREIEIADVRPGAEYRVHYAWKGPLIPDFIETVTVALVDGEITGAASFGVGFGVDVAVAAPLIATPPHAFEPVVLRIVPEIHGEAPESLAALSGTFDLAYELGLERVHFRPMNSVEQLLADLSFDIGAWVEALSNQGASLDSSMTGGDPGATFGDGLPYRVDTDGKLVDPQASGADRLPHYTPYQRGVHVLQAQIRSIVHGTQWLAVTSSAARRTIVEVDLKDAKQEFLDAIAIGCTIQMLQAVGDEAKEIATEFASDSLKLANALKALKISAVGLIWSCLGEALQTELADQLLAQHVLANTLVMTLVDTVNDIGELPSALKETVLAMFAPAKGTRGFLVESREHVSVFLPDGTPLGEAEGRPESDKRTKGPAPVRPADVARLHRRGDVTGFYAVEGETLRLALPAASNARLIAVGQGDVEELGLTPDLETGEIGAEITVPAAR